MSIQTTYSQARANLKKYCDDAADNNEVVIIRRRNGENVALISEKELSGLMELAHLLRSPENAARLFTALRRSKKGSTKPKTIEELRREVNLEKEKR